MRRKRGCSVAVLFLLGAVVICMLTVVRREHPKCRIESLALSDEWMPGRWQIREGDLWPAFLPERDRLGAQQAYQTAIGNDSGGAISHTVYQYRNRWLATFRLWFDRETFFPSVGWTWKELEEANNLPLHAGQQQIKCGTANPGFSLLGNQCSAVLRYGPYISDFGSSIGEEGDISIEEFMEIVLQVDERFTSCVE
jgi:hypothetical protein